MLGHFLRRQPLALTLKLQQQIVIRYQKRKSMFDTTSYNPDWIPRQTPYHKLRKPRMAIWSDPEKVVPHLIPPLRPKLNNKQYIRNVIQQEQKQKSMRNKLYILEPIRAGDIVEITYQETYENEATVVHKGIVLSFKRREQLTAALEVMVRLGGMNIKAIYLVHSPKIKNIKLVSKGSGNLRSNIKHRWRKIGKNQALRPRIRNRVMKKRYVVKSKPKLAKIPVFQFDKVKSDNVKRIVRM